VVGDFLVEQREPVEQVVGEMAVEPKLLLAKMEMQILVVAAVVVGIPHPILITVFLEQVAQASSFSNGPSPYKSQIPLHLPVHG
jgi:hypothetical protein